MFGISSVFKKRKARQFNYMPRYYDPEQEERNERKKTREAMNNSDKYVPGAIVRNMRMERHRQPSISKNDRIQAMEARNRIIIRLLAFIVLLFVVGYVIMNSTVLERILSNFVNR